MKAQVVNAKHEHKSQTKTDFPASLKVGFATSVLTVSSHVKAIMVQADKECYDWVCGPLLEEIEERILIDASSQSGDSDQVSSQFFFKGTHRRPWQNKLASAKSDLEARDKEQK